ncbi:hypothetical protein ACE6H2_009677 [Prunus campanulata]
MHSIFATAKKTVVFIALLFLHQIHVQAHSSYICQLKSLENERCLDLFKFPTCFINSRRAYHLPKHRSSKV